MASYSSLKALMSFSSYISSFMKLKADNLYSWKMENLNLIKLATLYIFLLKHIKLFYKFKLKLDK